MVFLELSIPVSIIRLLMLSNLQARPSRYRMTKSPYSWDVCVNLVFLSMESKVHSALRVQRQSSLQKYLVNSVSGMPTFNFLRISWHPSSPPFLTSLVPPQTPENVDPLVIAHLEKAFAALKSKNTLTVEDLHGGKPWVTDHRHWNFEAAKRATKVRWLCWKMIKYLCHF